MGRAGVGKKVETVMTTTTVEQYLGDKADYLLQFSTPKISRDRLHLPGPDFVDRIFAGSDRGNRVLANLQRIFCLSQ